MFEEMYRFETAQFAIVGEAAPDDDLDLSWDETGETRENLESGLWVAFCSRVRVIHKASGAVLGSDHLGGSVYENPSEFFAERRNGYFPDMVREAVRMARETLRTMPAVRAA